MNEAGLKPIRRAGFLLASALLAALSAGTAAEAPGQGFPLRGTAASPAPVANHALSPTSAPAPVQAAVLSAAPTAGDFENQPFAFPDNSRRQPRAAAAKGESSYSMPSILPGLLCVALVCGAFIGILVLAKRYLPGHRQYFAHPAMEVLGRTHLDQRRYVSLVRVGKRILVIGVSPDEINPLSEITDESEITTIMEVARPKTEAGLTIFQRLFQRQVTETDAAETRAIVDVKARELEERTASLRERVGALRGRQPEPEPQAGRRVDTLG